MFQSTGTLIYSELPQLRLVLNIDPEIPKLYRSLLPKHIVQNIAIPMHHPHISVVRKATPTNMQHWYKYQNQTIQFNYDPYIHIGNVYCWLKCYSIVLENIREELGLPKHSNITRPPDEQPCFHTTIGNFKHTLRAGK